MSKLNLSYPCWISKWFW